MVVRADLAVSTKQQEAQHLLRSFVGGDRPGHDVGRPNAMALEQAVQFRQRVDVLERLALPGVEIPLVVALGVDADEQERPPVHHRSWSESPSVTCQRSVFE
jgi:hypothetical protein